VAIGSLTLPDYGRPVTDKGRWRNESVTLRGVSLERSPEAARIPGCLRAAHRTSFFGDVMAFDSELKRFGPAR